MDIQLPLLNLPSYKFSFKKNEDGQLLIFDEVRKKYLVLTPEEWVRQNFVKYLISEKKVPKGLIGIEKEIIVNNRKQRYDLAVFNKTMKPMLAVECKTYTDKLTQKAFDQIARYNITLGVSMLAVTNGFDHFYCSIDLDQKKYQFIKELPEFLQL